MKYIVKKESKLLEYLLNNVKDLSNNKIKSLLKYKQITVNGKKITAFDYVLNKDDIVMVGTTSKQEVLSKEKLSIIYEDKELIVVNKPHGLLSISTNELDEETLYEQVTKYIKSKNNKDRIFIVHRLDKETSGIIIFAKNEIIKEQLQEKWNNIVTKRCYYAIVEGILKEKNKTIKSLLFEDKNHMVYSNKKEGKEAITEYKVLKENNEYSLLDVNILTGRKNQIRVHMSDIGHPIIGDTKYYSKKRPLKRLGLHAYRIELIHPVTKKRINFTTPIPAKFKDLFR